MKESAVFQQRGVVSVLTYPAAQQPVYSKYVFTLIACFSLVRLLLASSIQLSTDESYYWLYTQRLSWNYFDHPAMVAIWGRVFTLNLLLQSELFVRLGSIVSSAFATWFIYKATATFSSPRGGWYAAVLLNTSFYAGIVAGLLIMPDSPQLFFWTLSLWMISRIMMLNENSWTNWLLFGLAAGLCIMSKVHGAFIWFGFLLYCLLIKNLWLRKPQLYIALFVSLLCMLPLIIWNWNHDFVTLRFHSDRVIVDGFHLNDQYFRNEWLGQLLMNNPVNVALISFALTIGYNYTRKTQPALFILICIGLPLCLFLLLVSLFRSVYPHWSGPAYISLIPVAAIWLAQFKTEKLVHRWLSYSITAFAIFVVAWRVAVNHLPGTTGSQNELTLGEGDITLDRFGWKEAGQVFQNFYTREVKNNRLPGNTPLVTHKWWGAHIEYYFCKPRSIPMIGLGKIDEAGTYLWMNERYKNIDRSLALCVIPSDEYVDAKKVYGKWYNTVSLVFTIDVYRGEKKAHRFYIYQLKGFKG